MTQHDKPSLTPFVFVADFKPDGTRETMDAAYQALGYDIAVWMDIAARYDGDLATPLKRMKSTSRLWMLAEGHRRAWLDAVAEQTRTILARAA